jgi:hypothetical protein
MYPGTRDEAHIREYSLSVKMYDGHSGGGRGMVAGRDRDRDKG